MADGRATSNRVQRVSPEAVAEVFHEAYERLAPGFHYDTRRESAVAWEDVPDTNRKLMIAVAAEVLARRPTETPGEVGRQ